MERFIAWQASRDMGTLAPTELRVQLEALTRETDAIVRRIDELESRTSAARDIVSAYRRAHNQARLAMEQVLDTMRLGSHQPTEFIEQRVLTALHEIHRAQTNRQALEARFRVYP